MDWFSRRVLAWRLSIGMDTDFCVEALQEAMERFGQPEVSTFIERLWRSLKYEGTSRYRRVAHVL